MTLTFPTEFPTTDIPAGFTGANVRLFGTDPARLLTIGTTFTSGAYATFYFSGQYFTS